MGRNFRTMNFILIILIYTDYFNNITPLLIINFSKSVFGSYFLSPLTIRLSFLSW